MIKTTFNPETTYAPRLPDRAPAKLRDVVHENGAARYFEVEYADGRRAMLKPSSFWFNYIIPIEPAPPGASPKPAKRERASHDKLGAAILRELRHTNTLLARLVAAWEGKPSTLPHVNGVNHDTGPRQPNV